jgi:sugar O-acyltransferase (sialic acid O-acetyltransferase NeuD family)
VVAEIAELLGYQEIIFFDDCWPNKKKLKHWPIEGTINDFMQRLNQFDACLICIGSNSVRAEKHSILEREGIPLATIIHPSSIVSSYAYVGPGSVVMAGAVINTDSYIGKSCIINTRASVDHDCNIKDFAHLSPGSSLAGGVHVGNYSWVGIGASVNQGIIIGSKSIVGAGAVVVSDVHDAQMVVGVPAKFMKCLA